MQCVVSDVEPVKLSIRLALFRDGKITWYRIIVLFTYGASLAIDLQSRGQTEMIQQIPNLLASEAFNTEVGFLNRSGKQNII